MTRKLKGNVKFVVFFYKTGDFTANKIVEYITRDTFESLAYEINDLKSKLHYYYYNVTAKKLIKINQECMRKVRIYTVTNIMYNKIYINPRFAI